MRGALVLTLLLCGAFLLGPWVFMLAAGNLGYGLGFVDSIWTSSLVGLWLLGASGSGRRS